MIYGARLIAPFSICDSDFAKPIGATYSKPPLFLRKSVIIAIDESGTFTHSPNINSWSVVGAYVFSERIQSRSYAALKKLKKSTGASEYQEIKLKNVSEKNYLQFINDLSNLGGLLFSAATDSHINDNATITNHRTIQSEKIRINIPNMTYESARKGIADLANKVDSLSPQLYIQLLCQVELMSDILNRGILYYAQRDPQTLRKYKWKIDQKNTTKTTYKYAFEKVACPLLQTKSFRDPMVFLEGADYSHMKPFIYSEEEVPKYIENAYGKKLKDGVNIGKIVRDDMHFQDSKKDLAIQIADLLSSGIRKCLRSEFSNNHLAAKMLGSLMLSNLKGSYPIMLLGFQDHEHIADDSIKITVNKMKQSAKYILLK